MTKQSTKMERDRRLLEFQTYEEYLDSLVKPMDLYYLRSRIVARYLAELGYRRAGTTLSKDAFYQRRKAVKDVVFPIYRAYILDSELTRPTNNLQLELALRERSNRLGTIMTIIFLRYFNKLGHEVSGYIDFKQRLNDEDWSTFFQGKKRLWLVVTDLSYYHWRKRKSLCNSSSNFQPIIDSIRGLLFKNLHDRRIICVDPSQSSPGINTTRVTIETDNYQQIVLYDHIVHGKR